MQKIFMLRRRQRGGFMAHRPACHELEDVVQTELHGRPWCRKPTGYRGAVSRKGKGGLSVRQLFPDRDVGATVSSERCPVPTAVALAKAEPCEPGHQVEF